VAFCVPKAAAAAVRAVALLARAAMASSRRMAADEKTMFEIYRETDYNRAFHSIFYTELEEHAREKEIARAAAGETVYSGFVADERKEAAREEIERIVDELNDMDEDEAGMPRAEIERRLAPYLVSGPGTVVH
jgi:hypothetical protein